jgi:DNA-directed RNA polymerase subunit M/transcription elongation factor TFIIS
MKKPMKCQWCGGALIDRSDGLGLHCMMCGRSADINHEIYVMQEQAKNHKNWHIYQSEKKEKK